MSTSPSNSCTRCSRPRDPASKFCGHCGARLDDADDGNEESWNDSTDERSLNGAERRSSDRGPERDDPWLGKVVDNRYRVVEVIGRGGMGVVYKVEHQRMGKIAAMKVLHREYAHDSEVISRFRREAEAISQLTHHNTVQVFDFGNVRGSLYLIMEYIRGRDLGSLVKRDGPMQFAQAAPLFAQICSSLTEAHTLGIIHRDLKPENVLVTRTLRGRDFVKVLDFGLAKLSEREEKAEQTDRGAIIGTPYYMSPEQIRGENIDARTDIYALGALMYRILTGEHAFAAKTPVGVLTKHLTTELILPSKRTTELSIPSEVDDLVARAMAKKRSRRFRSIGALQDELERVFLAVCEPSSSIALPEMSSGSTPLRTPVDPRGDITGARADAASDSSPPSKAPPRPRTILQESLADSDAIDYGIDTSVRLRRSDLDSFESSLKRRRIIGLILVPLVLMAIGAAAFYLIALRPASPHRVEREPNNELDSANLIASGTPVTGFLGKRISKTTPDRDYFRVASLPVTVSPEPGTSSGGGAGSDEANDSSGDSSGTEDPGPSRDAQNSGWVVTAHVTSLPNIDIELSLFDATGTPITRVSEGALDRDEWLRRFRVIGPFHIMVSQVLPSGTTLPIENVSDSYTLTVTVDMPSDSQESEPNETPSDAMNLAPGQGITGYLDRRSDIDTYRFIGPPGRYTVIIEGGDGVPITWRAGDGDPSVERRTTLELAIGDMLRLSRTDRDLPSSAAIATPDAPYTLRLSPSPGE